MRGTLNSFCAFLKALHADGNFFPISRIELKTQNPKAGGGKPNREGLIRIRYIEVTVVCSSFFRPMEKAPKLKLNKKEKARQAEYLKD